MFFIVYRNSPLMNKYKGSHNWEDHSKVTKNDIQKEKKSGFVFNIFQIILKEDWQLISQQKS